MKRFELNFTAQTLGPSDQDYRRGGHRQRDHLQRGYQRGDHRRSLTINLASDAQILALSGPSGCGKTTMLHIIAGLFAASQGYADIGGRRLFDREQGISLSPQQRQIAMLFQHSRLFPHMSVADNLDFAQQCDPKRAPLIGYDTLVEQLELSQLLAQCPDQLSGGEIRRTAFARSLLAGGDILLLDEPFISLDPARNRVIIGLIEQICRQDHISVICVSHEPQYLQSLDADIVAMDGDGNVQIR